MKGTKVMLASLGTLLATWMVLALICYLLSETISYREACLEPGVFLIMIVFGWIPAVIVGKDIDDELE